MIGRRAPVTRKAAGAVVSGAHKALSKVEGAAGGATDAWQDLRQLILLALLYALTGAVAASFGNGALMFGLVMLTAGGFWIVGRWLGPRLRGSKSEPT